MDIIPRTAWGAAPPRSTPVPLPTRRLTHIVTHWPGDDRPLSRLDAPGLLRAWQSFHMTTRGWRDIGYNYAIDARGNVYEARGWHVGGHVLGAQNAISVGIVHVLGNDEPMTPAMMTAGHHLRAWIEQRAGRRLTPIGHSDWANKLCPGPHILRWTRQGMPAAGAAGDPVPTVTPLVVKPSKSGETAATPAFPLGRCRRHSRQMWYGPRSDLDHQVSGWANRRTDGGRGADGLYRWQERMAYRGWRITADGLWGEETDRVARAFQREKMLTVGGAIDEPTWAAAWAAPIT